MTTLACLLAIVLLATDAGAQSRGTDFSGHWLLVTPDPAEPDTLQINAPDQLVIRQTSRRITIEHPSRRGSHPAAGIFPFGSGGLAGGSTTGGAGRWGTTFFGTQLMMSTSTTSIENGVETTVAYGSFWLLDRQGRLVIEFREERSKERPKIAIRVYVRKR